MTPLSTEQSSESQALGRLERLGGTPLVRRMIAMFLEVTTKHTTTLREADVKTGLSDIVMAAHSLRTSAGIVGATRLSDLATDAEQAATDREMERLAALCDELCCECDRVVKHLTTSPRSAP